MFAARFNIIQRGGVEKKHIFSNIRDEYEPNITLWRRLGQVLDHTRRTKLSKLQNTFADFEKLFHPYIEICNSDTCRGMCKNIKCFLTAFGR